MDEGDSNSGTVCNSAVVINLVPTTGILSQRSRSSASSQAQTEVEIIQKQTQTLEDKVIYSIKLINPVKKSEYHIEKWPPMKKIESVSKFKEILKEKCEELCHCRDISFGYIEPGHGLKGRQCWIVNDADITNMYQAYKSKKEVQLWCHPVTEKRTKQKVDEQSSSQPSKRAKCSEKNEEAMDEVKGLVLELQLKHGNYFSAEQYNAWAQLINMKKHSSLDLPPDFPFFRGHKKPSHSVDRNVSTQPVSVNSVSPSKRIVTRSELLNQLGKISDLFDKGNIDKSQYEKLQTSILKDMDLC